MYLPDLEFHDAHSIDEAVTLMAELAPDARFLAGGTDLLVDLKTGRLRVGHVIGIGGIDALRGITLDADGLRIGALGTINDLNESVAVRDRFPVLLDAGHQLAAQQIRNMATVGGNITSAVPSADMPPILMVMNAQVALQSPDGARTVPLDSFFLGPRETVLAPDEILVAIHVPEPSAHSEAAYARFAHRRANSCAVAGVAASLVQTSDGAVEDVRVALGAVAPTPCLVPLDIGAIVGRSVDDDLFDTIAQAASEFAAPITDVRGTSGFRRQIVSVLAKRALATAHRRIDEAGS